MDCGAEQRNVFGNPKVEDWNGFKCSCFVFKKYESRQEKIGKLKLILPELRLIAKIKDCVVLENSKIQHACLSVFIRNSPFVV